MNRFIPVNTPLLRGNEKKYITECIETGWVSSEGPFVAKFEKAFVEKINRNYGVAVSNGTAALDIAIEALGLGKGDEIILPTFTIISCIHQIVRSGATPVLIDCDPKTWNMDVHKIESKITSRTKAIMIVHIYGLPVDINPVLKLADKYKLFIIEDAAEAIGQTYRGKQCGSFGDISTFSFYPNKHITTGEGGMVVTNNKELDRNCRSLRNLCFNTGKRFLHERLGWNYRMTNLQAALGVAQLEQLDDFIDKKRIIGGYYKELLKDLPSITLPEHRVEYAKNIYWVFGIIINPNHYDKSVETIMLELQKHGIGTRPFFVPLHKQPILNRMGLFNNESYPIADHISKNGFYLPSGLGLTTPEIRYVSDKLLKVLES